MSGSDSGSNRSLSPSGPVPTPGYGLENRSRSNSPASPARSPGSIHSRKSRSRSGSRHSSSRSRSPAKSQDSKSPASHHSRSRSRSRSSSNSRKSRSRSGSRKSRSRSGSRASNRSGSAASNRSRSNSAHSKRSGSSGRSRSGSPASQRSKSSGSAKSRNSSKSRSRSRSNSPNSKVTTANESPKSTSSVKDKVVEEQPKKSKIIDTDSEIEDNDNDKVEVAEAADLFGDADDISSDEEKDKDASDKGEENDDQRRDDDDDERGRLSGEENEQQEAGERVYFEPEPIPETRIDVNIPKLSCDLGKEIHFVKLPNFLSVETRPFDPETYEDEIDEEETLDEEGRARLKLKVENTIRWRDGINKEGDTIKESNARLVRWSDGSLSLHLGSEIFDVYKQPLQGDHNHLFIRQGTGLQGQAVFRTKLSFRPHSTESFTHRKMTLSLADRSQKTSGIKILTQVGVDPDQDRATLLKKEEEKLRQTFRMSKPRSKRGDGPRMHGSSNPYREEEGSEDEGAISLNAIKNKYKSGAHMQNKGGAIYSSDEEGSDFEGRRTKKLDKPRALVDSESSEMSE